MDKLLKLKLPYLDTPSLMNLFVNLSKPKDKITKLVASGDLIRIKQGLYVPGPHYKLTYSKEVLANMIYGPSYISLEYALSFYGLIPEKAETVTSICAKRNKFFKTPVGNFSYKYLEENKYPVGVNLLDTGAGTCLFASREKALCDLVAGIKIKTAKEAGALILNDLRMDWENLKKLKASELRRIKNIYRKDSVSAVVDWIALELKKI